MTKINIRKFSKRFGHVVVGKLMRRPDIEEYIFDKQITYKHYIDEIGNSYKVVDGRCIYITTPDGAIV